MDLYLARHAEAARVGGEITHDADRILTPKGVEDAALMGRVLIRLDPGLKIVATSPLKRAVQTGELIAKSLKGGQKILTTGNLAPGFKHRALVEELFVLSGGDRIVAVGHQPDVGEFLSFLVAGSAQATVAIPPAAVARIFVPQPGSTEEPMLHWLLTPEIAAELDHKS